MSIFHKFDIQVKHNSFQSQQDFCRYGQNYSKNFFSVCLFYFIFLIFIYLFIYGCIGSSLLHAGFLQLWCTCFSLRWLLLLWSMGSRCEGFSSCGMQCQQLWFVGSRVQAQQLWHKGLVAPWHVGSSRTRAQTRVPCIGRRTLNHCTTRELTILKFLWKDKGIRIVKTILKKNKVFLTGKSYFLLYNFSPWPELIGQMGANQLADVRLRKTTQRNDLG